MSVVACDILVEADISRMHTFYRIANLFTDVQNMNNRVKKRNWLKFMIDRIPFAKKYTYDYLYRIAFIRSGDYLGMYMRLLLIGGLLIYFIPSVWMKLLLGMLFLYLRSLQMIKLDQH